MLLELPFKVSIYLLVHYVRCVVRDLEFKMFLLPKISELMLESIGFIVVPHLSLYLIILSTAIQQTCHSSRHNKPQATVLET